jgi:cold shock CspA family protein
MERDGQLLPNRKGVLLLANKLDFVAGRVQGHRDGFGFLVRDDGQPDAFVHISAVERSGLTALNEGERYEFDLEVDRRGKHSAVNLVPIEA